MKLAFHINFMRKMHDQTTLKLISIVINVYFNKLAGLKWHR